MKRILTAIMAAAMTLGAAGGALAVDVKISGMWDFNFGWTDNTFKRDSNQDHFVAQHRVWTQADFVASETLSATLMFEIGETRWGSTQPGNTGPFSGYALDSDGVNIKTKRAYMDWIVPSTDLSLRMGIQEMNLPSATGFYNPVLGCDVAGIAASIPVSDMVAVTALWARPFDAQNMDGEHSIADDVDMFSLVLPVTGDGWQVTPWASYAFIGNGSGLFDYMLNYWEVFDDGRLYDFSGSRDSTRAWWAGLAVNLDVFEPLSIAVDGMYGHMNRASLVGSYEDFMGDTFDASQRLGMKGWFLDATINYATDWGTPGLFGWYTSGDDYGDVKDGMYGRIPTIGYDNGFEATTFGSLGVNSIPTGMAISCTMLGTWGAGVQVADVSFVEDLSHTLRFAYYRGTNDHEVVEHDRHLPLSAEQVYLTDKDSAIEINFDHRYQIYENLTAYLELGYIHLMKDHDVWDDKDHPISWGNTDKSNAWKAQMYFQFMF